jgi:hypothetical protein
VTPGTAARKTVKIQQDVKTDDVSQKTSRTGRKELTPAQKKAEAEMKKRRS